MRYSPTSIALHWIMAALMIAAFGLGQWMEALPRGDLRISVRGIHILVGLSVLVLLLPRLVARRSAPDFPAVMPMWERIPAKAVHVVLYALMLLLPLTGLVAVFTSSRPSVVLGLFTVPNLFPAAELHGTIGEVHEAGAKLLLVAFALHVIGALWHAIVRRDGITERMLPARR